MQGPPLPFSLRLEGLDDAVGHALVRMGVSGSPGIVSLGKVTRFRPTRREGEIHRGYHIAAVPAALGIALKVLIQVESQGGLDRRQLPPAEVQADGGLAMHGFFFWIEMKMAMQGSGVGPRYPGLVARVPSLRSTIGLQGG